MIVTGAGWSSGVIISNLFFGVYCGTAVNHVGGLCFKQKVKQNNYH